MMSLSDRVMRAGNAAGGKEMTDSDLLERLRCRIQEDLSADKLAFLAKDNPEQARNEVRSTCRHIFDEAAWDFVGPTMRESLVAQMLDSIFGFGALEDLIADESITEIMVNGPQSILIERAGTIRKTDRSFSDVGELRALIDRILGPLGRRIDEASPMVNARLPQGHRVNVVVPPVALDGPYVTIRKFTEHAITLEEMCESGTIDETVRSFLVWAVLARLSIAVSGGTGSGKTTLLNALSCVIPPGERIVTIEDSAELRFQTHPDVVRLEARPRNAEGKGEITIRDLVVNALRMRPDRIIVGECRGAEAIEMLQAMNTGHAGSLTTLHANSPEESISRLTTMVRYGSELPVDVIEANIASAIHLVVQTERTLEGQRRVCAIVTFSFDRKLGRCVAHPIYERRFGQSCGRWSSCPSWIDELQERRIATSEEVGSWKRACSL